MKGPPRAVIFCGRMDPEFGESSYLVVQVFLFFVSFFLEAVGEELLLISLNNKGL